MPRLIWTAGALEGLGNIHRFLAEKDARAAAKALDAIRKGANVLRHFPQAGRPAEDLEPEHRELLIPFGASGYAIFYETIDDSVCILAVKHQKEAGY
jgi:plasmid stabilization system protein ParE